MVLSDRNPTELYTTIQPNAHVAKLDQIESFAGVKIGIFTPYFDDADPRLVKACRETLDKLVKKGAELVEIEIPHLNSINKAHSVTIVQEMVHYLFSFKSISSFLFFFISLKLLVKFG